MTDLGKDAPSNQSVLGHIQEEPHFEDKVDLRASLQTEGVCLSD